MARAFVRMSDAFTGAALEGAVLQVVDAGGEVVLETELEGTGVLVVGSDDAGSLPPGAAVAVARSFEPGPYLIRTVRAPWSAVSAEAEDGGRVSLRREYGTAEKMVMVPDTGETPSFELLHAPTGAESVVAEDGGPAPSLARDLLAAAGHPRALLAAMRRPFARDHVLSPSEGRAVAACCAASIAATTAALAWLAAPFLQVLAISAWGLAEPGFGASFAAGNVSAYLADYALRGWDAVSALRGAYPGLGPSQPAMAAACAALAALIAALEARWFARRFSPANPILDALPPAAGHGEYGTAELVTSRRDVEDAFGVRPSGAPARDTGMYVGFYGPGPWARLASSAASLLPPLRGSAAAAPQGGYVVLPGDCHTIIFGDTRAGKTRRLLLATIMQVMRDPSESAIIFDPKCELYGLLKEALEAMGVECVVINFKNPSYSSRWNMLDLAIDAWDRGDYSKAAQLVADVVADLAPAGENEGTSKYFNDGARSYIKSAALKVISDPTCPRDQKTVATVSRVIEAFGAAVELDPGNPRSKTFVPYAEMLEALPMDHPAVEAYSGARAANDKELKAFCSTVQTFLALFRDPALASMTSVTDNPFRNVATRRQAVFLVVPEKQAYAPFAKMYLNQAYNALVDIADEGGESAMSGRLPQRVNFICEELCSIPKWDNLATAINIGAGRGIRFFLVVQNKALFEARYEKDAMGILGNCTNRVFIKTGDAENTARWLSTEIGPYTIEVRSESLSGGRFSPVLMRRQVSTSLAARERLKVDEILRWKADYGSIVRVDGRTYVVPLPDVSQTPVQAECGLGDMRHNLEKIYRAVYGSPPRSDPPSAKWSPELTKLIQGKSYSDKQRRRERAEFVAKLAAAHKKRMYRQGAAVEGASGGRALLGALLNPATGELKRFDAADEAFIKATHSPKHKSWEWKVAESMSDIEAWAKERRSAAAGRRGRAPDGQLPLIDAGSLELRSPSEGV